MTTLIAGNAVGPLLLWSYRGGQLLRTFSANRQGDLLRKEAAAYESATNRGSMHVRYPLRHTHGPATAMPS